MAPYFNAVIPSIVILSLVCGCGPSQATIPSDPPLEIITPSPENLNSFDVKGRQVVYTDVDVKDDSDTGQLSDTTDVSRSNEQDYLEGHQVGNNPVPPDMTMLEICLYTSLMNGPTDPINLCQVSVEDPPPLRESPNNNQPKTKVCSAKLGENACLAAGGLWVDGGASAPACDCN